MLSAPAAVVSLSPQPSRTVIPAASKNSSTSAAIGAAPLMASRRRSPKSARTLASTSRSASCQRRRSSQPTSASSRERNARPVASAQRKIARLCARCSATPADAAVKIFSNTRGTQVRCVGLTSRMSSSRSCGSRCQKASVPPTSMVSIWTIRASECASGRNMNVTTGGSSRSRTCSYRRAVVIQLAWLSMQALGGPVVPEV